MQGAAVGLRPGGAASDDAGRGGAAFVRSVSDLLERVEYRRCDKGEDLEAIYRLRYRAYRTHGIVDVLHEESISDWMDDAPNCGRFGMFIDGELASTIRVHHLTAETPTSPAMTVFGDVLMPRLEAGDTFIDPSRLAADPQMAKLYRPLPYLTLRLAVIASAHFGATSCLSMIRDDHAAFYRRIFNSVQVGMPRPYASVNVMAILFESRCDHNMQTTIARFPFFKSTPAEQRMLFDRPPAGDPPPLTVLPTAKYRHAA